jgi:uncharacterized membrane protein HdeD (DUF308 family)
MAQDLNSKRKNRPCPSFIPTLSFGCFAVLLSIWLGVDLNGRFFGIDARLTSLIALVLAATGCCANYVMVRHQPKRRFLAILMGAFCMYCLFDIGRHFLSHV